MPLYRRGTGQCSDLRNLPLTISSSSFGTNSLRLFVQRRSPLPSLSYRHLPNPLAPCTLSLCLPSNGPLTPFVVIRDAGQIRQSGRWQAMDANRYRSHNALSSLTHEMSTPPTIGAELPKRTAGKFHRQCRRGRRHLDHSKLDRAGGELIAEVRKHPVDLCQRKGPGQHLHDRRRLLHPTLKHKSWIAGQALAELIQIGRELIRVAIPRILQQLWGHVIDRIFNALI